MSEARRLWRETNVERIREYSRSWRARNRDRSRQLNRESKRRADGVPEPTRPAPIACELCDRPPSNKRVLAADHDHATGKFRGWLCHRCNTALGLLGDTMEAVEKALRYLQGPP